MKNLSVYASFVVLLSYRMLCAEDKLPRIEIGPVLSSAKQTSIGDYHVGGGGRVTFNFNPIVGAEIESTRQPTGNSFAGDEVHTSFAAKGTYRKEQARWLKFAGLNFFGVAGLGFLNRSVGIVAPYSPSCIRCTVAQRQTRTLFDFGGGFEVVPAQAVAIRFDVSGAKWEQEIPFFSYPLDETRVFLKVAVMFRFK
jgi:hypothetical protein